MAETLARYIVYSVSLTQASINFCGGGNFELLLPNTKDVSDFIEKFENDINRWLLENFHGDLGFVAAATELSASDLKNKGFGTIKDTLGDRLNEAKQKKYRANLESSSFWVDRVTIDGQITICKSCNLNIISKKENICEQCDNDKKIGSYLPDAGYLVFSEEPFQSDDAFPVTFGPFGCASLIRKNASVNAFPMDSTVYALEDSISSIKARYFLARTLPVVTKFIENVATEKDESEDTSIRKGQTLSFTTLSDMSAGDKRMGILKMDVDNLGLIFGLGLDVPPSAADNAVDLRSISRLATLSRELKVFFAIIVDVACKKVFEKWLKDEAVHWKYKDSVSNIFYLVFSGGDDLLIIGPWDRVIEVATEIRREFKDFTCHNPNITISAGIYICKPKFPISLAVKKAGEALTQSKDKGRNRITVMGETAAWAVEDKRSRIYQNELRREYSQFDRYETRSEEIYLKDNADKEIDVFTFEELTGFANNLEAWLKEGIISRGFVQRLLAANERFFPQYYNDIKDQIEEIHDMNVIPHMIYNIERNVKKGGKEDVRGYLITNGSAIKAIRQAYYPCKQVLMKTRK